jgi:uncharacterized phosphosugar-binding protein
MPRTKPKKTTRHVYGNSLSKDIAHIWTGHGANILASRWGAVNSRAHLSDDLWLDAYLISQSKDDMDQMLIISEILKYRGVVQVAQAATTTEKGMIVIEVFGFEAHKYLPSDISRQVKGRHLEDQLGL